jgi:hypothetical protein
MKASDVISTASNAICETIDAFGDNSSKLIDMIFKKVSSVKKAGFRFMFEIDQSEKSEILAFWREMPFDLEIQEHLGNCVFCIKKGDNKIELAARDEPGLALDWASIFEEGTVRDLNRSFPPNVIYRGHLTMQQVRMKYQGIESWQITERMKGQKVDGTSAGCSESCSAFSNQIDMFE